MDEQESARMDEREFRRILDLFPIVRSRHYNADEQLSKGSTSKSSGDESIREWQDSWDEGSENEPESEGINENDAFWEKLKLATEKKTAESEEEDDIVCLDTFFINDDYQLTKFTFGSQVLELYCLQSASTDFDLTGQLVWPGAMILNEYLSKNVELLQGCSVLELGSGVGITGVLCRRFCRQVVLTDHSNEVLKILKKNIELHSSSQSDSRSSGLVAEKLEWGNSDQVNWILERHHRGFDLILGADICFQQASVPLLFDTVKQLLQRSRSCKFILAYVFRAKSMDSLVVKEAIAHGMQITEMVGTRSVVGNLEGFIYEEILPLT